MSDEEIVKICDVVGQSFPKLIDRLRLDRYSEHFMEGGDGIDDTYRYDLGSRWLFIQVHVGTGKVNKAFVVDKRKGATPHPAGQGSQRRN